MFTGLVIETGELLSLERTGASARLTLRAPLTGPRAEIGDSVAVNGCCLTVTVRDGESSALICSRRRCASRISATSRQAHA